MALCASGRRRPGFLIDSTRKLSGEPAGSGTVDVSVVTPTGRSSATASDRFTYVAPPPPLPVVTSLTPTGGPAAGGTAVTITGTGFAGTTAVTFGTASAASFQILSPTSISAVSPAGSGIVDVTVIAPGGTSATSATDRFTYAAPPSRPVVTSLTPSSGPSAGGTVVTITGSGFPGAGVAFVTATGATTVASHVDSDTQIEVLTPAGTGTVDVIVGRRPALRT